VFPVLIVTLSAFWIVSGVIGLVRFEQARDLLAGRMEGNFPEASVFFGSIADIAVGGSLLVRRWTRSAAWASIVLAAAYLVGGALITPELWSDPLGPMVKVFPAMALALAVAALAEER
jgi:uncharacterized membrane protein